PAFYAWCSLAGPNPKKSHVQVDRLLAAVLFDLDIRTLLDQEPTCTSQIGHKLAVQASSNAGIDSDEQTSARRSRHLLSGAPNWPAVELHVRSRDERDQGIWPKTCCQ